MRVFELEVCVCSLSFAQASADSAAEFPFNKVQYAVNSTISMATLAKSRLLTGEGAVKKTLELEFNIEVHVSVYVHVD